MNATRKTIDLSADDLERFWEKVQKGEHSECWEWLTTFAEIERALTQSIFGKSRRGRMCSAESALPL